MGDRLTREQILSMEDITTEFVDVPEWGGVVQVRGLSGSQRDEWEASMQERKGRNYVLNLANIRAKLVQMCCIDETGSLLFQYGDIEALGRKSAAGLDRVYEAATRLSGIGEKDIEEMVANFTRTPGDDGSLGSPKRGAARSHNSSPQHPRES